MDKYDLVLDIIEHPEKYTTQQLAEIMSDPATRDIYNLLCKTESVIKDSEEPDVSSEWEKFSSAHMARPRSLLFWFGSRAASIAAIAATSIVAVAAGIAVTVSVIDRKPDPMAENAAAQQSVIPVFADTITAKSDPANVSLTPVLFENEPLETIMKEVEAAYGVEVKFNNIEVASLHLYYKLDPSLPLEEVVEQLNTFEHINIKQQGRVLNID